MDEPLPSAAPDGWEFVRAKINQVVADDRSEWAGAPLPVHDLRLVIEPRYPYQGLNGCKFGEDEDPMAGATGELVRDQCGDAESIFIRNEWSRDGKRVIVWHNGDGRSRVAKFPETPRATFVINTLGASRAWSVESEMQAMRSLRGLITEVAYRYYVLTGSFLETSPRSGVTYLFRKNRPTVALRPGRDGNMRVLAALCLHPIGYYEESFAGCMVPTDEVIAHVILMRGDEADYWRQSNQHAPNTPRSGL